MAKKYYGEKKMSSGFAGLPKEVKQTSYPSRDYAIMEGGYTDTQPALDRDNKKMVGKVKKMMRK